MSGKCIFLLIITHHFWGTERRLFQLDLIDKLRMLIYRFCRLLMTSLITNDNKKTKTIMNLKKNNMMLHLTMILMVLLLGEKFVKDCISIQHQHITLYSVAQLHMRVEG